MHQPLALSGAEGNQSHWYTWEFMTSPDVWYWYPHVLGKAEYQGNREIRARIPGPQEYILRSFMFSIMHTYYNERLNKK